MIHLQTPQHIVRCPFLFSQLLDHRAPFFFPKKSYDFCRKVLAYLTNEFLDKNSDEKNKKLFISLMSFSIKKSDEKKYKKEVLLPQVLVHLADEFFNLSLAALVLVLGL